VLLFDVNLKSMRYENQVLLPVWFNSAVFDIGKLPGYGASGSASRKLYRCGSITIYKLYHFSIIVGLAMAGTGCPAVKERDNVKAQLFTYE
jgi:hypothetical protein